MLGKCTFDCEDSNQIEHRSEHLGQPVVFRIIICVAYHCVSVFSDCS
jgi:hypothetical protein